MRTLDRDMADHVQDGAEAHGVRFLLSTEIEEIVLDDAGRPCSVRTTEGELPVDHVTIGTGARPATCASPRRRGWRSARPARCASTTTSAAPDVDGVYAAGDCVESHHRVLDAPAEHPARHAREQAGPHRGRQRDRRRRRLPGRRRDRRVEGVQVRGRPHRHHRGRGEGRRHRGGQRDHQEPRRARPTTRARARSGSSSSPTRRPGASSAGRSSASRARRSASTSSPPACGRAWRSTSSRSWTSPTRRRTARVLRPVAGGRACGGEGGGGLRG